MEICVADKLSGRQRYIDMFQKVEERLVEDRVECFVEIVVRVVY